MRKFNISPNLKRMRDVLLFITGCTILPNVLGSVVGCGILYMSGYVNNNIELWDLIFVWIVGNIPSSMVFGFLLVKVITPVLKGCGLYYEGFLK